MQQLYLVIEKIEETSISKTIGAFLQEEDAYNMANILNKHAEEKMNNERDEAVAQKLEEAKTRCIGLYDDPDDLQDHLNTLYQMWMDDYEWKVTPKYFIVNTVLYYSKEEYLNQK